MIHKTKLNPRANPKKKKLKMQHNRKSRDKSLITTGKNSNPSSTKMPKKPRT